MAKIGQKWDLSKIPDSWFFSKSEANARYKKAISRSNKPQNPGVPRSYLKKKVNGKWFYRVSFIQSSERRNFERDLWASYGFYTHYDSKFDDGFYVRRTP